MKKILFVLCLITSNAYAYGPYGMPNMSLSPMVMGQAGIPIGAAAYGMPGIGMPPPPRINPQNFNLPPPQYQTIWDGNCMCYRPFMPSYPY